MASFGFAEAGASGGSEEPPVFEGDIPTQRVHVLQQPPCAKARTSEPPLEAMKEGAVMLEPRCAATSSPGACAMLPLSDGACLLCGLTYPRLVPRIAVLRAQAFTVIMQGHRHHYSID